ncbi:MAG: hypothetical protein NXH72_09845 [Hyphomonadaceae bacterium]|nr:hypothetical protein [Hyphomonadaceae bacterium]
MADIIGVAASAAGGGLFGLFGTALGRVASYFEKRQAMAHEERRWQHETELLKLQQAARAEETEAELALAQTQGSWSGLDASLRAEAAIAASYRWVDAIRALTRPVLTLLLWGITTLIWFSADLADRASITETATFAATAATLWWFGDRSAGVRHK